MDYHRSFTVGKDREKKRNGKEKGGENEGARENLTVLPPLACLNRPKILSLQYGNIKNRHSAVPHQKT